MPARRTARSHPSPLAALLLPILLTLSAGCGGDGDRAAGPSSATSGVELRHDTGTATLPSTPERIVTTSDETTELVVALGLEPVGAGSTRVDTSGDTPFADYYIPPDRLGDPAFVGGSEIRLEAVAALDPDLIVHGSDDEIAADLARTTIHTASGKPVGTVIIIAGPTAEHCACLLPLEGLAMAKWCRRKLSRPAAVAAAWCNGVCGSRSSRSAPPTPTDPGEPSPRPTTSCSRR